LATTIPPASRSPQVGHAATAFATIIKDAGSVTRGATSVWVRTQ
jgi:hypothetical protein